MDDFVTKADAVLNTLSDPNTLLTYLNYFLEKPCTIMCFAFLIELFLPIPKVLRFASFKDTFAGLGRKVNRIENSQSQNFISGLFLCTIIIFVCLFLVVILKVLSGFDVAISIVVLACTLEISFVYKRANLFYKLMRYESPKAKENARLLLQRFVLRDCKRLSSMGLCKAMAEHVTLFSFAHFFAVLFWYSILGLEGAVLMQLSCLLSSIFNVKLAKNVPFGLSIFRLQQALCLLPALFCLFLLSLLSLHPLRFVKVVLNEVKDFSSVSTGLILSTFAHTCGVYLGGPRFYDGNLVRYSKVGEGIEPNAKSPLYLIRKIRLCGVIYIGLSFIITAIDIVHK